MIVSLYQRLKRLFEFNFPQQFDFDSLDRAIRIRFYQFTASLFVAYFLYYAWDNYKSSFLLGVYIDIFCTLYFILLLSYLSRTQNINKTVILGLPLTTLITIYVTFIFPAKDSGVVWLYAVSLFLIFAGGRRLGKRISIMSLFTVLIGVLLIALGKIESGYTVAAWAKILLSYILILIIGVLAERRYNLTISLFKHKYFIDNLTGKYNRMKMKADLISLPTDATFVVFNINGFTTINNFYGKEIGDQILKHCSNTIEDLIDKKVWNFYKLTSDEFGLLSTAPLAEKDIINTIKSIIKKVSKSILIVEMANISIHLTAGISNNKTSKLETANMALQYARSKNENIYLFTPQIDRRAIYDFNLQSLNKLKAALDEDRITVFFQPIYNNKTGRIEKTEALLRLIEPDGKIVLPLDFLDVARQSGLYLQLTSTVLRHVAKFIKEQRIPCSINITGPDIYNYKDLFQQIKDLFPEKDRSLLIIELLEDHAFKDIDSLKNLTVLLKSCGCKLAIDDFGSGYSNFSRLMEMDIDFLKIDGALIKDMDTNKKSHEVVKTIVQFAQSLGIRTIAEYVHSKEVLAKVKNSNCDFSQGYFIGKPTRSEDFQISTIEI